MLKEEMEEMGLTDAYRPFHQASPLPSSIEYEFLHRVHWTVSKRDLMLGNRIHVHKTKKLESRY